MIYSFAAPKTDTNLKLDGTWDTRLQQLIAATLGKDDDDGSENVGKKKDLAIRHFKLNRVYLDPLSMSNAGDFSQS